MIYELKDNVARLAQEKRKKRNGQKTGVFRASKPDYLLKNEKTISLKKNFIVKFHFLARKLQY